MMRSRQPPVNWPSNRAIRCLIKFPGTWNAFFHGAMKWRVCWKLLGRNWLLWVAPLDLVFRVGSTCKEILDFLECRE